MFWLVDETTILRMSDFALWYSSCFFFQFLVCSRVTVTLTCSSCIIHEFTNILPLFIDWKPSTVYFYHFIMQFHGNSPPKISQQRRRNITIWVNLSTKTSRWLASCKESGTELILKCIPFVHNENNWQSVDLSESLIYSMVMFAANISNSSVYTMRIFLSF